MLVITEKNGWVDGCSEDILVLKDTTKLGVERVDISKVDRYQLEFFLAPGTPARKKKKR